MNTLTLVLSLASLVLAAVAYWRAGGQRDLRRARLELERKVETLRAKQDELTESVAQALSAAYESSRRRLAAARRQLRELKDEAAEGLATEVRRAQEELEALAARLEAAAKNAKESTAAAAQTAERSIAFRVRRIEARATLLQAQWKAGRAVDAAAKRDFERADQLLGDATELLRHAQHILADDHARDELLEAMKLKLHSATAAVRSHAADARQRAEFVLTDAERLVAALESDDLVAAGQS